MQSKLRTLVELVLLASTAIMAIIIAILDLSGWLDSSSWVAQRIPSLTLIALGFMASYLILERKGSLDVLATSFERRSSETMNAITSSANQIIQALDGVDVVSFNNGAECAAYLSKQFRKAKCVEDVTWSGTPKPRSGTDLEAWQKYQNTISNVAQRPGVVFREIVSFGTLSDFERERERVLDPASIAYNLGYYVECEDDAPPRQGFAIFDRREVVIGHTSGAVWLAIQHPDIVRWFSAYFEDLWAKAEKLKIGDTVQHEHISELEGKLKQQR